MAAYNKFYKFVEDLAEGVHDILGDQPGVNIDLIKVYLSNAAPNAGSHTIKANVAEITNQHGYDAPESVTPSGARSDGTITLTGTKITIAASGGSVGPFQYVVLYNDTPADPVDPLIAWWDYGLALTLADGESIEIKFNSSDTTGTIFTIV